jgi:hypothetical protein
VTGIWTIDGEPGGNAFFLTPDGSGKVYINIVSDYSDALDMGYSWFGDDGKFHLNEICVEETEGEHYGMMAADNTVFTLMEE